MENTEKQKFQVGQEVEVHLIGTITQVNYSDYRDKDKITYQVRSGVVPYEVAIDIPESKIKIFETEKVYDQA